MRQRECHEEKTSHKGERRSGRRKRHRGSDVGHIVRIDIVRARNAIHLRELHRGLLEGKHVGVTMGNHQQWLGSGLNLRGQESA